MRKLKKKIISILKFATSGKFQKYRMYEEKMKELDSNINLGKVTENDFQGAHGNCEWVMFFCENWADGNG